MKSYLCFKQFPLALAISMANQVWATEVSEGEPVQIWGTAVNNSSLMLDDADIELKQADHLSDLLRDQPGVDIGGAHSLNQRINIRGFQDLDLEVTIDGARQNNFMYHHAGNLLINADILKAVDIQVGTNSVLNGGLAGGVAFETKDAKDLLEPGKKFGARIHASYANNDYHSYSFSGYGQLTDTLDVLAYINGVTRNNPEDGSAQETLGNDGDIKNGLLKFGFAVNDENRIEFGYDKYADEGNYAPRPDMGVATNASISGARVYPTEFDRETRTLTYELDKGDTISLRATLYQNTMTLWRNYLSDGSSRPVAHTIREGESEHVGLNLLAETVMDQGELTHTLRYGTEIYNQKTLVKFDGIKFGREEADSAALFIEDVISFSNGLTVTPGIRYNRYKLDTAANDRTFTDTTWGLAAEYPLTDFVTVRASSTQLFKGPNLSEVFTGAGAKALTVNPDLEASTGVNHEVGISYQRRGIAGLDRLNASFTLYTGEIENYIDDEGNSGSLENVGDYDMDGYEAAIALSKGNFDARLSYAHSESENQQTGTPLGRQVGDSIAVGLDYRIPEQGVTLNWTALVTLEEEFYDKPEYDVHSISARWTPAAIEGLTLTAGIENVFDEYYTSHASRIGDANHPVFGALHLNDYEPGRNIKLSASYAF
ncbi:TonB-dependent receptor domain-containing protein [Motiliproteus sp. MSK22-1]|uniref:TonB-dependent receptor domain-containing protein n=1 Tax=Motiliproteus sp. MSK22-1 TaxID=1897630 RepID=UPI0009F844DE|nr:TonB-dependent receptor [Motiliproteus sp. MSK22-1]